MSNEANSNSKVNVLAKPRLTPSTISTGLNSNNPFGSVSSFSTGNSIFGQKSGLYLLKNKYIINCDNKLIYSVMFPVLRPSQLSNPFGTVTSSSTDNDKQSTSSGTASSSNASQSSSEVNSSTDNKSETVIPKFVPLHSSKDKVSFSGGTVGGASPSGLTRAAGFVFGQNLAERIEKNTENGNAETSSSSNHITSNGTSELLFSTAVQASADSQSTLIKVITLNLI